MSTYVSKGKCGGHTPACTQMTDAVMVYAILDGRAATCRCRFRKRCVSPSHTHPMYLSLLVCCPLALSVPLLLRCVSVLSSCVRLAGPHISFPSLTAVRAGAQDQTRGASGSLARVGRACEGGGGEGAWMRRRGVTRLGLSACLCVRECMRQDANANAEALYARSHANTRQLQGHTLWVVCVCACVGGCVRARVCFCGLVCMCACAMGA